LGLHTKSKFKKDWEDGSILKLRNEKKEKGGSFIENDVSWEVASTTGVKGVVGRQGQRHPEPGNRKKAKALLKPGIVPGFPTDRSEVHKKKA